MLSRGGGSYWRNAMPVPVKQVGSEDFRTRWRNAMNEEYLACPQCSGSGVCRYLGQDNAEEIETCDLCDGRRNFTREDILSMTDIELKRFAVEIWRRFCNQRTAIAAHLANGQKAVPIPSIGETP